MKIPNWVKTTGHFIGEVFFIRKPSPKIVDNTFKIEMESILKDMRCAREEFFSQVEKLKLLSAKYPISLGLSGEYKFEVLYQDPDDLATVCKLESITVVKSNWHNHAADELLYIVKGEMVVKLGESCTKVMRGQYFFIPANVSHEVEMVNNSVVYCFQHPSAHDLTSIGGDCGTG